METHVCPVWVGYFLASPLRKLTHDPEKILGPYIKPGMEVIDYGCAMGFFSVPMAKMVGTSGKVYCFDIQKKMLQKLMVRAEKANVHETIKPVLMGNGSISTGELKETASFSLLFAVVHEVPDREQLFESLGRMMKPGGMMLIAEPKGHVSVKEFKQTLSIAEDLGFNAVHPLSISRSHAMLMEKS